MADRTLPHLFPRNTATSLPYTNPTKGGGQEPLPVRNRQNHAQHLLARLDDVRQKEAALGPRRAAVGLGALGGITVEFDGEPGHELAVESLEQQKQGIRLLNVREHDDVVSATVFVPHGKVETFIKKVEQYRDEQTAKGNPKHQPLVASISDLRVAVLDAFWTDPRGLQPVPGVTIWWEVWLRADGGHGAETILRTYAQRIGMSIARTKLVFPDRLVMLVRATTEQMTGSVELLDSVAELRRARTETSAFSEMRPLEQYDWVMELKDRIAPPADQAPAVCLLDTGLNHQHPLLAPAVTANDCQAYDADWGGHDHDQHGHGTGMAGLALYGDLTSELESRDPVPLFHRLESVKLLPPPGFPDNDRRLYGEITKESVARAEVQAPDRKRVVCMAVTTRAPDSVQPDINASKEGLTDALIPLNDHRGRGSPSSWSSALDALSVGAPTEPQRLLVVSAGNSDKALRRYYPDSNIAESIHDPAQAWNVLTVGAYTDKVMFDARRYPGWTPVASRGGLSPSSTTSVTWARQWPIKPDVVMEGGNLARDPAGGDPQDIDDLQLLTTSHDLSGKLLDIMGDTSAAAALGARLAAMIQAEYPQLWPETVRALLAHSAEWTPAMLGRQPLAQLSSSDVRNLLRTYGYGVPDLQRARWSAKDALTLIVEDEFQPFEKKDNRYATKEMRLHRLPWPKDALAALQEQTVVLRVALSYFIEPSPGERGWGGRYSYQSHGLRFHMQTAVETEAQFGKRINLAARDEGEEPETEADHDQWVIGPTLRHRGSLHVDRWIGSAVDLAKREHIAVTPVYGWWTGRPTQNRWNSRARYSLVVSIESPGVDVDIYTPVATTIGIPVVTG